jgi:hypothetical protein
MKKNLLFIFVYDEYIRNFIQTKVFLRLKKIFNVKFLICENNISKYSYLKRSKDCLGSFEYSQNQIKDFNILNWSNSIINQKKSKTFAYQNIAIFLNVNFRRFKENILYSIFMFIPRLIIKIRKIIFYFYFLLKKNNEILIKKYLNFYPPVISLDLFKKYNPDLILFPSKGNHPALFEILNFTKKKTFLLCDNWDNPSSKSYLQPLPHIISVWGQQSKKHAMSCNNFKSKDIFTLGTPKYEIYHRNKNNKLKNIFKFNYILFLESWVNNGIFESLQLLNDIVSRQSIFKGYKILFRPHPHPTFPKEYKIHDLKNVILDPNIKNNYLKSRYDGRALTQMSYFPSLIKNSKLVICGPTTMVLESLFFHKKTLMLAFKGNSYFNHYNTFKNMIHLNDLYKFPNLKINYDMKLLEKDLIHLLEMSMSHLQKKKSSRLFNYHLTSSEQYYNNLEKCLKLAI